MSSEILLCRAERTGCEVDLLDVDVLWTEGETAHVKAEDEEQYAVDGGCLLEPGFYDMNVVYQQMKSSFAFHPAANGLWALAKSGKWHRARRKEVKLEKPEAP